jgi:hypothetical protein
MPEESWVDYFRRITTPRIPQMPMQSVPFPRSWDELGTNVEKSGVPDIARGLYNDPIGTLASGAKKWWENTTLPGQVMQKASIPTDIAARSLEGYIDDPTQTPLGAVGSALKTTDMNRPIEELKTPSSVLEQKGLFNKADPISKAAVKLGIDAIADPTNLLPVGEAVKVAALPFGAFKKIHGIKQLAHGSHAGKFETSKMVQEGFNQKIPDKSDLLNRWFHSAPVTPEGYDKAIEAGDIPHSSVSKSFGDVTVPVDIHPDKLVMDWTKPIPWEDVDAVIQGLDPVRDKEKIRAIKDKFKKQARYLPQPQAASEPGPVKIAGLLPERAKEAPLWDYANDPATGKTKKVVTQSTAGGPAEQERIAVQKLEREMTQGRVYGRGGGAEKHGSAALHPTTDLQVRGKNIAGIYHHDFGGGEKPAMASPPSEVMVQDPKFWHPDVNWKPFKTFENQPTPIDKPAKVPLPIGAEGKGGVMMQYPREIPIESIAVENSIGGSTRPAAGKNADVIENIKVTLQKHGLNPKYYLYSPALMEKHPDDIFKEVIKTLKYAGGPDTAQDAALDIEKIQKGFKGAPLKLGKKSKSIPFDQDVIDSLDDDPTGEKAHIQFIANNWDDFNTEQKGYYQQLYPDIFISKAPAGKVKAKMKEMAQGKTPEPIETHLNDIKSVLESHDINPGILVDYGLTKADIGKWTPEELHQEVIEILQNNLNHDHVPGAPKAAQELSELWKMKQGPRIEITEPRAKDPEDYWMDDIDISDPNPAPGEWGSTYPPPNMGKMSHGIPQVHVDDVKKILKKHGLTGYEEILEGSIQDSSVDEFHKGVISFLNAGNPKEWPAADEIEKLWEKKQAMQTILGAKGKASDPAKLWAEMSPQEKITLAEVNPTKYLQMSDAAIKAAPFDKQVPLPPVPPYTPPSQKIDVFNPIGGKTIKTFNSKDEALDWIESHPDKGSLDWATHDPSYEDATEKEVYENKLKNLPVDPVKPIEGTNKGLFQLKDSNPNLTGIHEKQIYTVGGKDYIFKPTKHPYAPYQELTANNVAKLAGLPSPDMTVETMGNKTGTMQSVFGNKTDWPTLRGPKAPKLESLTASQLMDIIRNQPVDWLTANHDAHRGQWLVTPTGIIEVDRGQAFKHWGEDSLAKDYNPNAKFGEEPSIYIGIQKLWKEGKLPQLSKADIDEALMGTVTKLHDNKGYVRNDLMEALERAGKDHLREAADERFNNLLPDMRAFWYN